MGLLADCNSSFMSFKFSQYSILIVNVISECSIDTEVTQRYSILNDNRHSEFTNLRKKIYLTKLKK